MTDKSTTEQDIAMTLATIEQQIRASADPALLTEGARVKLGEMYTAAEQRGDQPACVAIQQAWDDIQALAVDAKGAREFALTTLDVLDTIKTQRDDVMKEHAALVRAVDKVDLMHPKVAAIYTEGSDQGYQDGYEGAMNDNLTDDDDYAYDLAWEILTEKYSEAFGSDAEALARQSIFIDIMSGDIEVQPNRKREFLAWLDAVHTDAAIADEDGDDDDE